MGENRIGLSSWKLKQIGLVVKDMDKAVERFSVLGFGPFTPKILPPGAKEWFRGKPFQGRVDVKAAMVGNVELELCQPIAGDSPHQEYLDSKGEGIQHVMFAVDDLQKEIDRLTQKGAKVLLKATFDNGSLAYIDLDVGGFIIELVQMF